MKPLMRAERRWVRALYYRGPVSSRVPGGVVHKLPGDLRKALAANSTALDAWKDITPLARTEFICWVEDAKQEVTRERRSQDPGGAGGRPASALPLARVPAPRAHRRISVGSVTPNAGSGVGLAGPCPALYSRFTVVRVRRLDGRSV